MYKILNATIFKILWFVYSSTKFFAISRIRFCEGDKTFWGVIKTILLIKGRKYEGAAERPSIVDWVLRPDIFPAICQEKRPSVLGRSLSLVSWNDLFTLEIYVDFVWSKNVASSKGSMLESLVMRPSWKQTSYRGKDAEQFRP